MNSLKKCLALLFVLCLTFAFSSCAKTGESLKNDIAPFGAPEKSLYPGSSRFDSVGGADYEGGSFDIPAETEGEPLSETPDDRQFVRPAGLITAAAWNENWHYDFWKSLFVKGQTEEDDGKFVGFYEKDRWGFDSTRRVSVRVKQGDTPVCGAIVTCTDDSGAERFTAKTGADGVAYLFPEISDGTIKVKSGSFVAETSFSSEISDVEIQLDGAEEKQNHIQMMLVIDVTGSMGDELTYLQTELADVINRVAVANGEARIDLALLFYRDDDDTEKFAYYDFVNVNTTEGLNKQLKNLRGQRADGGGDTPEAVDEALELAMSKAWGDDNSTKIIFHVLDAPPHSNSHNSQRNYEQRFEAAVRKAAGMGIRLCPILCSGADLLCEYLVRQEAIYTGGTFIFVTDDSGIGNAHLDPNIPDAVVEKLNDLMVRVVDGYHTGTFADPVPWESPEQEPAKSN